MKRRLSLTIIVGSLLLAGNVQAAALPRVYIGFPNPAPCEQATKVHGKYVNHRVPCYQVRPSTISVSEDGGGFLSDLTWSAWKATSARGSGLESVRCYGVPKGQRQDPHCGPYRCTTSGGTTYCYPKAFSYKVPATIVLSVPVATKTGTDFTRLQIAGAGRDKVCLPPANSC